MFVYDKAYMDLKNKYLVPLTQYTVPYTHLRKTNVKNFILEKSTSVSILDDNTILLYFDEKNLFKALLGDIELFYIRKIIQNKDVKFCKGEGISANWNIVTNYYNAFFAASLMLRLCFRGNIFFDDRIKNVIEKMISEISGSLIKINSNSFYEVIIEQGQYVLKLSNASANTHELVWKKMDVLIDEMLILSRPKSDEKVILESIKKINHYLKNTFPSKLRNRVNYQTQYGLEYIDNKLYQINENCDWTKELLSFFDTTNDNEIACYMFAYTKYIEFFCSNFIAEYYDIRGNENGILKRINNNSNDRIEKEKARYIF